MSIPATPGVGRPDEVVNLSQVVARHAVGRPDAPALVEVVDRTRSALSYAQLERAVAATAGGLAARGLRAGDRVGLLGVNSNAWVVAYLSVLRLGAVAVPLNPGFTAHEVGRLIEHVAPRLVLADDPERIPGGVEALSMRVPDLADTIVETPLDPETLAVLINTSGSSGEPKTAMLSHRALLAHCRHAEHSADEDSVALGMLPFFHIYGLNAVLGLALYLGAATVVVDGMHDELARIVRSEGVTELPGTPSVLYRLLQSEGVRRNLAGVRTLTSGGAPLPRALAAEVLRATGHRVQQGYGLTEAAPGVSSTVGVADPAENDPDAHAAGWVGEALAGVEVRVDADRPGEPGELSIRGANLFSGYWPDGTGGPDDDGWFRTGDVAFTDTDGLHLVDRASELILVSGFNVYPAEIESVLRELPEIADAAVLGQPDEQAGERVVAFVTAADKRPSLATLRSHCAQRLARYKRPVEVFLLPRLPRTTTGKTHKGRLREMLDNLEQS